MPYMAQLLKKEPLTDAIVIPTRIGGTDLTTEIIRRYMRLYFPRSYDDLISKFEFLLLRGIDSTFFTNVQFDWMKQAIEEAGLGALQDRSVMSSLTSYSVPWAQSSTSEAFPNNAQDVVQINYARQGPMEVVLNDDAKLPPILSPYKDLLTYNMGHAGNTMMIPRQGADVYSWVKSSVYMDMAYPRPGWFPHTLGWRYGKGYSWSLMDYSGSGFWSEGVNPYGMDAYWGMLMYSTGRTLPDDVVMVHNLRKSFYEYADLKGFIFSIMEFVAKFGASTRSVEQDIAEMDAGWKESRSLYLQQDYQSAWTTMELLLGEMDLLRGQALKIKDKALLWIYVIEWLTVSGTFLGAGFALWTLMVRRRLYRVVESTKLESR